MAVLSEKKFLVGGCMRPAPVELTSITIEHAHEICPFVRIQGAGVFTLVPPGWHHCLKFKLQISLVFIGKLPTPGPAS